MYLIGCSGPEILCLICCTHAWTLMCPTNIMAMPCIAFFSMGTSEPQMFPYHRVCSHTSWSEATTAMQRALGP